MECIGQGFQLPLANSKLISACIDVYEGKNIEKDCSLTSTAEVYEQQTSPPPLSTGATIFSKYNCTQSSSSLIIIVGLCVRITSLGSHYYFGMLVYTSFQIGSTRKPGFPAPYLQSTSRPFTRRWCCLQIYVRHLFSVM